MLHILQVAIPPEALAISHSGSSHWGLWLGVGVLVFGLGLLLGALLSRLSEGSSPGAEMKAQWPRDWAKNKKILAGSDDATKPGYLPLAPNDAMGSGAMPMGRTNPRLHIFPDRGLFKELRRKVEYFSSEPVFIPYKKRFQHFFVLGATGKGKSTAFAVPALAYGAFERARPGFPGTSYFAIDVKSPEFARTFGDLYKQSGKPVYFLDPWSLSETLGFEPLWRASAERKKIIADVIISYSSSAQEQSSSENSEFFKMGALRLMQPLLDLGQFFPRRYCNLPCIQQLIGAGGPSIKEALEKLPNLVPTLDETLAAAERIVQANAAELRAPNPPDALAGALAVMDRSGYRMAFALRRMRHYTAEHATGKLEDGKLADIQKAFWNQVRLEWKIRKERADAIVMATGEFINMADDTRNSVVSTVAKNTMWFQDENIAAAFSRDEFDVNALAQRPCLMLVGAPQAKKKVGAMFVSALLTNMALNAVYQRGMGLAKGDKRTTKHGIFFILDEFPQLGVKDAPDLLATFRGFLSGLFMIFQELGQMRQLYGENATTMEANTVHRVLLAGSHFDTAKRYSEQFGNVTIKVKQGKGEAQTESSQSVPLMDPSDLMYMKLNGEEVPGMAMSCGSDTPPFPIRPVAFYEDPVMQKMLKMYKTVKKSSSSGKEIPVWQFWNWEIQWAQEEVRTPYLSRRMPGTVMDGDTDVILSRRDNPYTQYLDYLLGDSRGIYDELIPPILVLRDIGVVDTSHDPGGAKSSSTAKAGAGAPNNALVIPVYSQDFQALLRSDFAKPDAVDAIPVPGGSIPSRMDDWIEQQDGDGTLYHDTDTELEPELEEEDEP